MRLQKSLAAAVAASILISPIASLAAQGRITFDAPVTLDASPTAQEVLMQSENYDADRGVLTVDDHEFVFDAYGHAVLKQPDQWWGCRWLGLLCTELEAGPMPLGLDAAKDIVRAQVIPAIQEEMRRDTKRVLPLMAFAWPEPMPEGSVVRQLFRENAPINVLTDSWFFFLDLEPHAMFGHRVEYVLVDGTTGAVTRRRVYSPPIIGDEAWLVEEQDRFTTDARFYPESLDDLAEPFPWPLKFESPKSAPPPPGEPLSVAPAAMHVAEAGETAGALFARLVPTAEAQQAPSANADPCANQRRRKVGIVINGEPRACDQHFDHSAGAAAGLFRNLGVEGGDLHWFRPETHPTPEEVIREIERIGSGLGPCDKLFFYITGHGTLTDSNNDGVPDRPSQSIVYGEGTLEKARYGNSFTAALEKAKAGDVNIIVQSCFAGSILTLINDHALSPPAGSEWHVFVSSTGDRSSYGNGDDYRSSPYTENLSYCISLKLAERGIRNPSIEQIEELMRECQQQMADNPETYVAPLPPQDVGSTVVTVAPTYVEVVEGDEGDSTNVPVTVSRSNTGRPVTVTYYVYMSSNPTSPQATPGWDFENIPEARKLTLQLTGNTLSDSLQVAVFGDDEIEPDEDFYIWIPELSKLILVHIKDDDSPAYASSSSAGIAWSSSYSSAMSSRSVEWSSSESSSSSANTVTVTPLDTGDTITFTFDPPLTIPGGKDTIIFLPLDEDIPTTKIELTFVEEEPQTDCPNCEEIVDEIMATMWECVEIELALEAAEAKMRDLQTNLDNAKKELAEAEKALNEFDNPRSWVESGGRRVTSTDLKVTNQFNREAWQGYKDGDATAQETSDAWGRGPTAEDRERIKEELREKLQQDIDNARQRMTDIANEMNALKDAIEDLQAALEECGDVLEDLWMELEECEKRCMIPDEDENLVDPGRSSASSESDDDDDEEEDSSSSEDEEEEEESSSVSSPATTPAEGCKTGTWDLDDCEEMCDDMGQCIRAYDRGNDGACYRCVIKEPVSSSSKAISVTGGTPPPPQCPSGKTADAEECEEECNEEGGTCTKDSKGCYSCVVLTCPGGTYKNECPNSCPNGCDVAGQQEGVTCYVCKKSCAELCETQGYMKVGTDWTSHLQSYLNQYTCVSGASVRTETATVGSCTCSNEPQVTINTAVPVCKGTACGDVACGQSASCQQGNDLVTVSCNWGGWKNVGENQFQPMIAQ